MMSNGDFVANIFRNVSSGSKQASNVFLLRLQMLKLRPLYSSDQQCDNVKLLPFTVVSWSPRIYFQT